MKVWCRMKMGSLVEVETPVMEPLNQAWTCRGAAEIMVRGRGSEGRARGCGAGDPGSIPVAALGNLMVWVRTAVELLTEKTIGFC